MGNLEYVSKLVETVVAKQLQNYLFSNDLFLVLQSAYRPNQSTETALLKVTNDIFLNMNNQRVTLLFLLDLSAAFDTIDHDTLLHRLQFTFGINRKKFTLYLSKLFEIIKHHFPTVHCYADDTQVQICRYTTHSDQTTGSINLMLESYPLSDVV